MKKTFRRAALIKKSNNTITVILCKGAIFVKKNPAWLLE